MTYHTIGIKISKAHLESRYAAPAGSTARFSNDAAGLRKLIAWIGPGCAASPDDAQRIPWHRDLRGRPAQGRASPVRDQSLQSLVLRITRGPARAKTDAIDARTLPIMADAIGELRPT